MCFCGFNNKLLVVELINVLKNNPSVAFKSRATGSFQKKRFLHRYFVLAAH